MNNTLFMAQKDKCSTPKRSLHNWCRQIINPYDEDAKIVYYPHYSKIHNFQNPIVFLSWGDPIK